MRPRVLFLVPAQYDRLREKGVDHLIRERDEEGFFERVVTVHPLGFEERVIDLDSVHRVYEFPLGAVLIRPDLPLRALIAAPFRIIAVLRAIVRVARAERVDLVRATDPYLMGLLGLCASRLLSLPFCVSIHADYRKTFALTPKRGIHRALRLIASPVPRLVMRRADLLLPISGYLAAKAVQQGARPDAIRVIPHGIDTAAFRDARSVDARALFRIPASAPVISWVSRMSGENYSADIPAIVERVLAARPGVVFVLAGGGPCEEAIHARLRSRDNVRMVPFQSQQVVAAIRAVSTAALCLIGGFSLIEACAAGVPVVAYDIEWHREIIEDGVSGLLVEEHDIDGVVAALERLLGDPAGAAEMGRRAQEAAFARHDVQVTSRIKQDCYRELLQQRVPA